MLYYLALPFTSLLDFFDRGGPVIIVLFVLAIVMTTLLIERLFFFISELKDLSDISVQEVSAYKDVNSWVLNKIKSKNISVINVAANRNLLLIQGLIALCPLLGLLGTVTGMIEVFDVMALSGSSNARLMAGGVFKATIPTMAGMTAALSGLYFSTVLPRWSTRETARFSDELQVG